MIWTNDYEKIADLTIYYDSDDDYKEVISKIQRHLEYNKRNFIKKTALEIVKANLYMFIGYEIILINVEDYYCVTKITDEWYPITISNLVFPFDQDGKKIPTERNRTKNNFQTLNKHTERCRYMQRKGVKYEINQLLQQNSSDL